ncbi:MAG TPA: hypothetical protein VF447_13530 [Terriglobales bacterium]
MRKKSIVGWLLLFALLLVGNGCQIQTQNVKLCEALQQQGDDATCWLRDELKANRLVAPKVLVDSDADSLGLVLQRIAKEKSLDSKVPMEFENEVARFVVQCTPDSLKDRSCVWTLISHPKVASDAVFAPPLLEAVEWVRSRASSQGFKLVLLEQNHIQRKLSVEIRGAAISIEWSDSEAQLVSKQ